MSAQPRPHTVLDVLAALIGLPILALYFLIFDLLQRLLVAVRPEAHRRWVLAWARMLVAIVRTVWGLRVELSGPPEAIAGRPFLILANHQSPLDIAFLQATFGMRHPQFIARAGMDRGLPCLSYYLRHGGGLTLRRESLDDNLAAMRDLARQASARGTGIVIFPEGHKNPRAYLSLRRFQLAGPRALLEGAPGAVVLPVAISGMNVFYRGGLTLPRRGVTVSLRVLPPVVRTPGDEGVVQQAEHVIREELGLPEPPARRAPRNAPAVEKAA